MSFTLLVINDAAERYREILGPIFPEVRMIAVTSTDAAFAHIEETHAIVAFSSAMSEPLLRRARRLRWIQALSSGMDGVLRNPALPSDVILTSTSGMHGPLVSEMALLSMLALSRQLPRLVHNQDRAAWLRIPGRLLAGKTVGILGVGTIGTAIAEKCRVFGMKTIGFGSQPRQPDCVDRYCLYDELKVVASELDYLVLVAPLRPSTHHLVDRHTLHAMKPTAFVVNVGRGATLNERDLIEALSAGRIAGAALDALAAEPLPANNPLWRAENVLITPHVGGLVDEYPVHAAPVIERNLRSLLTDGGASMVNVVGR